MGKQGLHVREKVAAGVWNRPYDGVRSWAAKCKLIEDLYPSFAAEVGINPILPWGRSGRANGSVSKALFMSLMHSSVSGLAVLEYNNEADERGADGKAFFKIARVVVPMSQRPAFDSLMFPSMASFKEKTFDNEADKQANKTRRKTVKKQWETAGFDETVVDGDVVFTFNPATYHKQKEQQCGKRKRVDVLM